MQKNKFLKIISSIFAVFAICGLCCFDLLFNKQENTQLVNAVEYEDDRIILYHADGDGSYSINKEYQGESWTGAIGVDIVFDYGLWFVEETGSFSMYFAYYTIHLRAEIYYLDDHETEYVYSTSQSPLINYVDITLGGGRQSTTPIFNDGDRVQIDITDITSSAGNTPYATYGFEISDGYLASTTHVSQRNVFFFEEGVYHPLDQYSYLRHVLDGGYTTHLLDTNINLNTGDTNYSTGYEDGYLAGYQAGVISATGNDYAYNQGYLDGQNSMESQVQDAYSLGYTNGYNEADSQDSVVTSIFNGFLTIGILPLNFFLSVFNFEILGINLSAFIKALFTVALTLIVLRVVFNGGKD